MKNGELFVYAMHISPYEKGNVFNREPRRDRRLLMHKREIMRLYGRIKQDGYALIPLSLYFKNSKVKVEIGLAKGKKLYDKREAAAERSAKRMDRTMKSLWQRLILPLCAVCVENIKEELPNGTESYGDL